MLPAQLIPILLLSVIALLVVAGMLGASHVLGPRRRTPVKQMPYESGMDPVGDARRRFDVRFYLVAIVFLIFDVELLFLYPWAVSAYDERAWLVAAQAGGELQSRTLVFVEVLVFMLLLALAYVYAWRKGVFQWGDDRKANGSKPATGR